MKHAITYFEIAAFVCSVIAWPRLQPKKDDAQPDLRPFPFLLFVVVVVEVYQTFFVAAGTNNAAIYNLQVPLQHLIYLYILYLAAESKLSRRWLIIAIAVFSLFTIVTLVFFTKPNRFNILSYCFGSVLIIIVILIKFYGIVQNPKKFDVFRNEPFFYILLALLLFNAGTLPYFTMSNWLHFMEAPDYTKENLIKGMSLSNYLLYSTYTFVFIWMIRKE